MLSLSNIKISLMTWNYSGPEGLTPESQHEYGKATIQIWKTTRQIYYSTFCIHVVTFLIRVLAFCICVLAFAFVMWILHLVLPFRANTFSQHCRYNWLKYLNPLIMLLPPPPPPPLRIWGKPRGAGRTDPAGQFPGLGSTLADQKGTGPTPLPVWVLPGLQQRDQGLGRQNQVPIQEQTTGECVF